MSQLQTNDNAYITSTPINSISTNDEPYSILAQSLPPFLAAPIGWESEIVHARSSMLNGNTINTDNVLVNNFEEDYYPTNELIDNSEQDYNTTNTIINNSEQDYYTTDTDDILNNYDESYDIENTSEIPINITRDRSEYINMPIDNNAIYQQQQQNIIDNVKINRQPPIVIRKKLPNNVTYKQNITVRYLKPPTPPPPGPLIIREVRPPPPPPQSPIQIRQRPPPCPSPPPLILRERPPPVPPRIPATVIKKILPPPPRPRRRLIVERYPPCPPKPSDVIIERWLPYKQQSQRRILLERAQPHHIRPEEPNLLVLHDAPHARVRKEFINEGVIRADPYSYVRRYGRELNRWKSSHSYLVNEATRVVPPPRSTTPIDYRYRYDDSYDPYCDRYRRAPSPHIYNTWERTRLEPSITRSSSYYYDCLDYDSPSRYCTQSSRRYRYNPDCYYDDDYCERRGSYVTMADVTSSWNRYCNSSPYDRYSSSYDRCSSPYYTRRSYCPPKTIHVCSDSELRDVLCDLTNGRVPRELRTY
ncbi:unnamed protein product [Rotaria sordida]|uniref:Uncharacterized protein n=1 Tax=Rotaria sordida TaxID=392033 RepID=A0A814WE59_9BILA|nr:unnamed protein product [Rotaria sordida]CAF1263858.1 unnamed protein product [Rotaria sordida]CAF3638510.1 unnamed protein product [Rotaria sordida]CAF3812072.1 unnamed protein product [Rotaria sordida]